MVLSRRILRGGQSLSDIQKFHFEGREFDYTFRPATDPSAPLFVHLHGHTVNPRPSKFRDPEWNVLCPVDNFGVKGAGCWYLGEDGDTFWLRAMPALIKHVYSGERIYFAGSSMGGYGAILHGILNTARGVYANIPQTWLLGSSYAENGMKRYFEPIFGEQGDLKYNDLKNFVTKDIPTTFLLSGIRYDKEHYLEEQTFPFLTQMAKFGVNFSNEIWLGDGHILTHAVPEIAEKFRSHMTDIETHFLKHMEQEIPSEERQPKAVTPPRPVQILAGFLSKMANGIFPDLNRLNCRTRLTGR